MSGTAPILSEALAGIAEQLAGVRLAAELFDENWNLLWVSDELKALLGEHDEAKLGIGTHILEARRNELWSRAATEESQQVWSRANLSYVVFETPPEILGQIEMPEDPRAVEGMDPRPAPPAWTFELVYQRPGFAPMRTTCLTVRLNDTDGSRIGAANVYVPALPATLVDLLSRGDERMFERMSRLVDPDRHAAAILFADLQASGTLSRRLPSAGYFRLIRSLTTAIDEVIGEFGGIVGKHAGDGVTAFFLVDDLGSPSAAARCALAAASGIGAAARATAAAVGDAGAPIEAEDVLMNVGVHWGGTLYMGQVVTGGRLEVTALGDEVNECARIQQAARDGAAYASKALIEHLTAADSAALGIDLDAITYATVAELPGADPKAIRDAGGIAVAKVAGA